MHIYLAPKDEQGFQSKLQDQKQQYRKTETPGETICFDTKIENDFTRVAGNLGFHK